MKKRIISVVALLFFGLIVASFFIRITVTPPHETRVILEHNEEIYIAPPCFHQVNASNFISEETLKEAQNMNYEPEASCTDPLMKAKSKRLIVVWLEQLGLLSKTWNRDGSWQIKRVTS